MVRVPSAREIARRYVRGCLRACLEGRVSREWTGRCAARSGLGRDEVDELLAQLRNYAEPQVWRALRDELDRPHL